MPQSLVQLTTGEVSRAHAAADALLKLPDHPLADDEVTRVRSAAAALRKLKD
jgi:hypothetical protein